MTFAGVMFDNISRAEKHEEETGIPLTQCRVCMSIIDGIIGEELTVDANRPKEEYSIVTSPITHINAALKADHYKRRG